MKWPWTKKEAQLPPPAPLAAPPPPTMELSVITEPEEFHGVPEPAPAVAMIKMDPESNPEFMRHYRIPITPLVVLEIDAKTVYGERRYAGYLHQWDGKLVGFNPMAIADRILDRDLIPLIEKFCPPIIAEDQRFVSMGAVEFVDRSGTRWIKG